MTRTLSAALGLALWTGGLLLAGRVAILFALEHFRRAEEASTALWRIAKTLPPIAIHALVAGVLAAVITVVLVQRRGAARFAVATLIATVLAFSALSGHPFGNSWQVPGLDTERGRQAIAVLSGAALVGALLLVFLAAKVREGRAVGMAFGTVPALVLGLALALGVPFGIVKGFEDDAPHRTVRVRVLDIAFEPEVWRATRSHPDLPVEVGVLTPSSDWRYDGSDLPGLVMAPPAEVRFTVPQAPEGLYLQAAAGIDFTTERSLKGKVELGDVAIEFEIQVDGRTVLEETIPVGGAKRDLIWRRLPAPGLAMAPGAEVVLSTRIAEPAPGAEPLPELPPLRAGFGGLVFERDIERPSAIATPEAPNVVFIVMDTQRADRLSCYGHPLRTTPNVDALAARGTLYEEAYATSSWTWPATASLLTGQIPEAHNVTHEMSCYLDGRLLTLAEALNERGYVTGAFTCNPLIVANKNFDQGFEHFDAFNNFRKTNEIFDDVQAWLTEHSRERFFLYLHLVDTHWSYELLPESKELVGLGEPPKGFPPRGIVDYQLTLMRGTGHGPNGELITETVVPPEHREHLNREYDAAVHTGDHYVGQILDAISELDLDERTVIIYTSDHGEEILDHGLAAHGLSLHRELTRVPLIMAGPSIPEGRRVTTRVSNRHLAPTIAMLAGSELPTSPADKAEHEGRGPVILLDPADVAEEPIYFSTFQGWWKGRQRTPTYGMIEDDWEVHYAPAGKPWGASADHEGHDFAIYHLATDPLQMNDLAQQEEERARAMIERMLAHHRAARLSGRELRVGAGRAALQYLQDIGYLGTDSASDEK